MSRYQHIRDYNDGFVDSSIGDTLVYIESRIVGVIFFFVLLFAGESFVSALILAILCIFVIPWLISRIKILGWLFGLIFSLLWGVLSWFVLCFITDVFTGGLDVSTESTIVLASIIITAVSMFKHKVFSGIGFRSVKRHIIDAIDRIRYNTEK